MAFPESFLQELAEKNDIEDVVSGYVNLTKRSGQNRFGLCPFHSEKSPSFSVNSAKQIYHCFGCGKGGSVINFIMEIESLTFPEAVEFLARRAGMTVPEQERDPSRPRRERLYALNRDAARFFHDQLSEPSAEVARAYIAKRQISGASVRRFGLGFAPDTWDSLVRAMQSKGYSERELADAGLVRRGKNGGVYDTFRMRLMFPVIDVRGNVVAFSGRALGDVEPKYMNSPETPVFSKSHNLFGLNLAKKSKSGYIILVEGNVDVVSLHQAGFDSAVASLGTSLTPEQARLLSRFTSEVVISYDADNAGKKAAERAIGLLDKLELRVRVLTVQGAKDPDEYIKEKGPDAFRNLIEKSEDHMEYRLQLVTDKYDLKADDQRVLFLREATDLVAALPDSVEREVYASRVASMAGVQTAAVSAEVERRRKRRRSSAQSSGQRELTKPLKMAQPRAKELRYDNPRSAAAEEGVVRLMYLDPSLFKGRSGPGEADFSSPPLWKLFSLLAEHVAQGAPLTVATLGETLTQDEASLLTDIIQKPENLANGSRALDDYIEIMRRENSGPDTSAEGLKALADELKKTKGYGEKDG